jgi:hypothetical protein
MKFIDILNESDSEKRVKNIYNALKKGKVTVHETMDGGDKIPTRYGYELNNNYKYFDRGDEQSIVMVLMTGGDRLKVYEILPNGEEVYVDKNRNIFIYEKVSKKIRLKFQNFNIELR